MLKGNSEAGWAQPHRGLDGRGLFSKTLWRRLSFVTPCAPGKAMPSPPGNLIGAYISAVIVKHDPPLPHKPAGGCVAGRRNHLAAHGLASKPALAAYSGLYWGYGRRQ